MAAISQAAQKWAQVAMSALSEEARSQQRQWITDLGLPKPMAKLPPTTPAQFQCFHEWKNTSNQYEKSEKCKGCGFRRYYMPTPLALEACLARIAKGKSRPMSRLEARRYLEQKRGGCQPVPVADSQPTAAELPPGSGSEAAASACAVPAVEPDAEPGDRMERLGSMLELSVAAQLATQSLVGELAQAICGRAGSAND